ncbi:hypothetical protein [Pseudomonas fluorescens]|uniref:Uncharacterized protein n=1 Tax=Pseudomonas fluorescens TaxID=294 RepID=A0A5E7IPB7_PSEFL|nr:hypothetical protein [Pseudomonas fluorescens]VVO78438.1 hypothetical protein PS880_01671 [Pseudomonas fluorescens]
MNEPIIQANESLIRNGDFEKGFSDWKKGLTSPGSLGLASEIHEGVLIRFLKSGNRSSVSQPLRVPKDPGAQARYILGFWCETRHTEAGMLKISSDGQQETLEIPLRPGASRDVEEDQARLRNGQPLEFKPIKYEVELTLPFNAGDTLTVNVSSPANAPNDPISGICITLINLQLHLEPAVMQGLMLDEEPVSPAATLYMCLGASASLAHRLKFLPAPDNAWRGTYAALTSDDNPFGAVGAVPDWGVDHPLENPWQLECPFIGEEEPYLFSMNLLNQYTAEPYPVNVSLGHHRLVFRDVLEAKYYPVLEYGQCVQLGVQVASYYTGHALSGRTVTWTLEGQGVKGAGVTNDQGWAYFDFEPQAHGNVVIQASVDSPYYAAGVVTQALDVRVLATDPWKEVLAVVEGVEKRWEKKTGYPNRGSDYPVTIKLPADSPLLGTELALHWSGDSHEQLGVVVSPALEHSVPVIDPDMAWTLTSEDRLDGRFYLELACSKLLLPSSKKTMSLARNLVKVGEVREANKFPVVDENESVLLRVQVVHVVVSGDGDPVNNAWVDWITPEGTISTRSGAGGWASVLYTPESDGDLVIKASIKAHAEAIAIEQPFNVKAIATSPWKTEVKFLLDDVEVERNTLGVLCRRGQTHTLKVVPVTGSSWVGKNISLHWRGAAPDIGLVPADLGTPKALVAGGVEWKLVSQANDSLSSLFELELRLEGVSTVRELSGRLMSADLTEEVSLMLDQIPAALDGQAFYPCLGALHRFNVLPNALSPLVGLESSLTWSGTPADQLGATIQPALNLPQNLSDWGANWTMDFTASQTPGDFALALALPQLNFVATAKPMLLAHNKIRIEAWRESPVDPVVGREPAWQWVQVFSHFTRHAVNQVPVTWTTPQGPRVVYTDNEGWSGIDFSPVIDGAHEIQALVISAFDGFEDKRAMGVTALANDPWEGLLVKFDGGSAHAWGEKTYFPRRKGEHTFELFAPQNSPLFDRDLTLGMTGTGPGELGIQFLPAALGVPRTFYDVVGLQYTFKAGDLKDASFALRLSSERLASLSPANAMSLGEGAQVVKITGKSRVDQTLDWGQEFFGQVTVVSVISGKAMVGWTVKWRSLDLGSVTSVTDFYGVAKVRFVPTTPGAAELIATVGDELNSDSVSLSFTLNEPRKIVELIEMIDSEQVEGRATKSRVRAKVVSSRTGLPLENVEVMWEYGNSPLPSSFTDTDGFAWLGINLSAENQGVLWATVKGGEGGWDTVPLRYALDMSIESLTCDRPVTYPKHEVNARATVRSVSTGAPLEGIKINWTFSGQPLPDSVSNGEGEAHVHFFTPGIGEYELKAALDPGLPGSKTQTIRVNQLVPSSLWAINAIPAIVQMGLLTVISVRVMAVYPMVPQLGRRVDWTINDQPMPSTYSNADGWGSFEYRAGGPGDFRIEARLENPLGTFVTSMTLKVVP